MHGSPALVQDGESCFAFGAAQLADAWRRSHPPAPKGFAPSFVTSGTKLFQDMVAAGKADKESGGFCEDALKFLSDHPSCDQESMYGSTRGQSADDFVLLLKRFYVDSIADLKATDRGSKEFRAIIEGVQARYPSATPDFLGLQSMFEYHLRYGDGEALCRRLTGLGAFLPTGFGGTSKILAAMLSRESPEAFVKAYLDKACAATTAQNALPAPVSETSMNTEGIMKKINERLDQPNAQPVAISYCAGVLLKGRPYRGRADNVFELVPRGFHYCEKTQFAHEGVDRGQQHTSLVVGRRENPKSHQCEFLVRNTWSAECTEYKVYASHWDCKEPGDIWVSQEDLSANTYNLTYLK